MTLRAFVLFVKGRKEDTMDILRAIKHIRPNVSDNKIITQDDGNGPYILHWNSDETQPTKEEISAAWQELAPIIPKRSKEGIDLLGEQLVLERIERMKTKQQLDQIGKELVVTKLELMQLKGGTSA